MNKRVKRKREKNSLENRMSNILNNIKEFFTIESLEFGQEDSIYDMGPNSVCTFELRELPSMVFKVVLCKTGFIGLGEHISFDFDLKPGKSSIEIVSVCGACEQSIFVDKIRQIKEVQDSCELDMELFKNHFIKIKEGRMKEESDKKKIFDDIYECKQKYEDIVSIAIDTVSDTLSGEICVYDINILVKKDILMEDFNKLSSNIWDYCLGTMLEDSNVQVRLSAIHKSKLTFKNKGCLI